ncbi:hypothetical protein [Microbacterium sp. P04]|uniref:hypothetical protein n=1 Tax=Microbacterium sp. P04 TaxID=3366947 RepID=UPI003745F324
MVLDDNEFDASVDTRLRDSFNTTNTTSTTLTANLDGVGNVDNSTDHSGATDVGVTGSFQDGSYNTENEWNDSGNIGSYNESWDLSDNSTHSYTDASENDGSVNAGVRTYSTGFGDVTLGAGGGAGGAGDVWVNANSTIVDQSVNANIASGSGVHTWSGNESVVASGDGAIAAGGDIDISRSLDASTDIRAFGDVNLGNETTVTTVAGSFNVENETSTETDNSVEWDIEESGNDYSESYTANNSFNDEFTAIETNDWDIDADVIWGSEEAVVAEDVDVDLPPL